MLTYRFLEDILETNACMIILFNKLRRETVLFVPESHRSGECQRLNLLIIRPSVWFLTILLPSVDSCPTVEESMSYCRPVLQGFVPVSTSFILVCDK